MPDPLSKSCLSLEMFVESWLHCPPRISISEKNRNNPPRLLSSVESEEDSDVREVKWLFCLAVI